MFCLQHPSTTSMLPTWTSSSKCNILECKQISDLGRSKSRWFLERYMTFTNWISNRSDHTQQCFEYGVFEYTHYKILSILVTLPKFGRQQNSKRSTNYFILRQKHDWLSF